MKLFNAFGAVDDDLISEAADYRPARRLSIWKITTAAAAVLCVLATAAVASHYKKPNGIPVESDTPNNSASQDNAENYIYHDIDSGDSIYFNRGVMLDGIITDFAAAQSPVNVGDVTRGEIAELIGVEIPKSFGEFNEVLVDISPSFDLLLEGGYTRWTYYRDDDGHFASLYLAKQKGLKERLDLQGSQGVSPHPSRIGGHSGIYVEQYEVWVDDLVSASMVYSHDAYRALYFKDDSTLIYLSSDAAAKMPKTDFVKLLQALVDAIPPEESKTSFYEITAIVINDLGESPRGYNDHIITNIGSYDMWWYEGMEYLGFSLSTELGGYKVETDGKCKVVNLGYGDYQFLLTYKNENGKTAQLNVTNTPATGIAEILADDPELQFSEIVGVNVLVSRYSYKDDTGEHTVLEALYQPGGKSGYVWLMAQDIEIEEFEQLLYDTVKQISGQSESYGYIVATEDLLTTFTGSSFDVKLQFSEYDHSRIEEYGKKYGIYTVDTTVDPNELSTEERLLYTSGVHRFELEYYTAVMCEMFDDYGIKPERLPAIVTMDRTTDDITLDKATIMALLNDSRVSCIYMKSKNASQTDPYEEIPVTENYLKTVTEDTLNVFVFVNDGLEEALGRAPSGSKEDNDFIKEYYKGFLSGLFGDHNIDQTKLDYVGTFTGSFKGKLSKAAVESLLRDSRIACIYHLVGEEPVCTDE